MKIGVCISKTPETTARVAFVENNTQFDRDGVNYILNPYDEWYALVRALELKEQLGSGELVLIHVGGQENDAIIRKALAIGADRAIRYDLDPVSSLQVAKQIADAVERESIDILFLGKETIDYSGAQVGAMVAEMLDWPFVSFVQKMEFDGEVAELHRDIEGGIELCKLRVPFVLSASKGLAKQRIPNMRGIMMAKRKPIEVREAIPVEPTEQIVSYALPEQKAGVTMVDPENMDELVRLLHEEAKII